MALEDNLVFAHFMDALDQDEPTANITRSNAGSTGDPSVSSGVGTFDDTSPSDSLLFTQSTGDFITGGTSDFTVAARFRIDTAKSNSNVVIHIGNPSVTFDRGVELREKSSVSLDLVLTDRTNGSEIRSNSSAFSVGTFVTVVARRSSSVGTIWVDGSDDTLSDNITGRDFNDPLDDITLGAHQSDAGHLDGAIDWVVVWDRALTDSEITNNMNETDLKNALGGASGASPVRTRLQTVPYRHILTR